MSFPFMSWIAATYPATPLLKRFANAHVSASRCAEVASIGRAITNRSQTRPLRCWASSSAIEAVSKWVSRESRSSITTRAAFGRVMYRRWLAVCPSFAARASFVRFVEKVFAECRNENNAMSLNGLAGIKCEAFYPLCAFPTSPPEVK